MRGCRRYLSPISCSGVGAWFPHPQDPGGAARSWEPSCWKGHEGRGLYLGRARLTNLSAGVLSKLKVCYRAVGGQAAEAGRPALMDSPGDRPILPATSPLPPARHVWVGKIISAILLYHRAWHCSLIGLFVLDEQIGEGHRRGTMADVRGQPGGSSRDQTQQLGQESLLPECPREGGPHLGPRRNICPTTTQWALHHPHLPTP